MEPPSYEEARLTAGCANLATVSASSDIVYFFNVAREQTHHLRRVKAMFTATEAIFWVMTSRLTFEPIISISHVLGAIAQYTYLYLQTYTIATQKRNLNQSVSLQLQQFFDKWQQIILEHPLLYVLSVDVCPLRHLTCDRAKYRHMVLSIQDLGYATIELALDRSYASVFYGGQQARAGFPQSYEWTCPYQEGKRRRQIRTVAEALSHCHEKRVFVADIGLRNILLDDTNNVVLIDFADSILFPVDTNMDEATDDDVNMQTEIFHFSLIAMSILTWKEEEYDLYATPPGGNSVGDSLSVKWPSLEAMPCTSSLLFGDIIRKCWLPGSYRNMSQVLDAVNDFPWTE